MNSGCVLGNKLQKILIKKITEADQLNFKVSLVRPKLVFNLGSSVGENCIQRLQRSLQAGEQLSNLWFTEWY